MLQNHEIIFVTLTSITPGEDVAGNPPSGGPPSGAQPPVGAAAHAPVGVSQSNSGPNAQVRLPRPSHARKSATAGQQGWLLALWLLLGALVAAGAAGAGYYIFRQRRAARG
ncbi:MAG TPA: hypothetical protein VGR57_04145 [Ktedonobacterales bacterium]|nr:hypothetical protein [Ktedonobacterales bacterium]